MSDAALWLELAQCWRENGCAASSGVTTLAVAEFEQRYSVTMPADVPAYFENMDGQGEDMGSDLFRFWPLSEVKPVSEELSDLHSDRFDFPGCFVFADYLIWSWGYAVEMGSSSHTGGAVYCIAGEGHNRKIASSFTEFIRAYMTDHLSILA